MTGAASRSELTHFHGCSACGKCCNSPPAMTLPELFHHQARFFGCLTLRRIPRIHSGMPIAHGDGERPAGHDDARAAQHLAELVLHALPGQTDDLLIAGQAFGYASQGHCPALDAAGRCGVHQDRKPLTCGTVPFDALLPDRLQGAVLSSRARELSRLGSDCIRTQPAAQFSPVVRGAELLDARLSAQLSAHRSALATEKRHWGAQVFAELTRERSFDFRALPASGTFELSLAPALLVLGGASRPLRQRCIAYLDAQAQLGASMVEAAIARRSLVDRPVTERLRAFVRTNATLRKALSETTPSAWTASPSEAQELERWLGTAQAAPSLSMSAQL